MPKDLDALKIEAMIGLARELAQRNDWLFVTGVVGNTSGKLYTLIDIVSSFKALMNVDTHGDRDASHIMERRCVMMIAAVASAYAQNNTELIKDLDKLMTRHHQDSSKACS